MCANFEVDELGALHRALPILGMFASLSHDVFIFMSI
jgi:hypothetical protein